MPGIVLYYRHCAIKNHARKIRRHLVRAQTLDGLIPVAMHACARVQKRKRGGEKRWEELAMIRSEIDALKPAKRRACLGDILNIPKGAPQATIEPRAARARAGHHKL